MAMNEPEELDDILKDIPDWLKDKQKDHPDWWEDFNEWLTEFKESTLGKIALSKMKEKLDKGKQSKYYLILEDQVLKNCFFAKTYEKAKDSSNNLRVKYGPVFHEKLKKQIEKINELRDFISEYPDVPEFGFMGNQKLLETGLFYFKNKTPSKIVQLDFDRLLEIYSEILEKPKVLKYSGPGGYRFKYAGICYPSELPLDGRTQRTKIHTILAFRLVELFRQHTNAEGSWEKTLTNFQRPMPDYGDPCYELAVDFICAIFDKPDKILDASDIKKSVCELAVKEAHICPWPQQENEANHRFFVEEGLTEPIVNKDGVLVPINFL